MFEALGGRKFLAGLLTVAAGIAVHVLSKHGLTTELATFLVAMYGTFSASNVVATISALKGSASVEEPDTAQSLALEARLCDIQATLAAAANPEAQAAAKVEYEATIQRIENGIALQNSAISEVLKRVARNSQG